MSANLYRGRVRCVYGDKPHRNFTRHFLFEAESISAARLVAADLGEMNARVDLKLIAVEVLSVARVTLPLALSANGGVTSARTTPPHPRAMTGGEVRTGDNCGSPHCNPAVSRKSRRKEVAA